MSKEEDEIRIASIVMQDADERARKRLWVIVLGLQPMVDGNCWSFLWGNNIQEGVCGFGRTPEAAMLDFEKAMKTRLKVPG